MKEIAMSTVAIVTVLISILVAQTDGRLRIRMNIPLAASVASNHSKRPVTYSNGIKQSVAEAVAYLLSQRQPDHSWGTSTATSRANVAMVFAGRASPMDEREMQLMKQQLNIQLSLDLISPLDVKLSHLALYINALYATCQDPRSFQGTDLVSLLRTETNKVMASNFSLPSVLLTICISGQSSNQDSHLLTAIYNSDKKLSMRALTVMAMSCISSKKRNPSMFRDYIRDFAQKFGTFKDANLDTYTKALVVQAANAAGLRHNIDLVKGQLEDGSFGDLLATYYSIPALLNSSLLELPCYDDTQRTFSSARLSAPYTAVSPTDKKATLSLWIASGANYNTHSMVLTFRGNETLYDLMKIAESNDFMYRFLCDEAKKGREVFSLAGIPNDPELDMSWKLYQGRSASITVGSKENMLELSSGIDNIFPNDSSHYIFWFDHTAI